MSTPTIDFREELEHQIGKYGSFVNRGRAFPSALDGLKVVHRHILWGAYKMRALPSQSYLRSSQVVGEVMGKYHPHGDAAIYSTMVGMAQSFKQLVPMLSTHGNFGSLTSGPAAPRYTKCRMSAASLEMLGVFPGASEIDEETVEFITNYDGKYQEPAVLPAAWPAFVVNGFEGLGVGMSGYFPSHNLTEVMNLAIKLVDTPTPRWDTIVSIMPGPDFPCDADLYDTGIEAYYRTGKGSVTLRAHYAVEDVAIPGKRKKGKQIVITGLPYGVSPEKVVEGVVAMREAKDLPADIDIVDSTAKDIRLVIDVKENDAEDIIKRLLSQGSKTGMQRKISIDGAAVLNGEVVRLGVLEALRHWIDHRRDVIRARSRYRLARAEARKHIVEGYIKVIPIAEQVIAIVRSSKDRATAEAKLVDDLDFSEIQAHAVLDLTLAQITRLGTERFTKEIDELNAIIADAQLLLGSPSALDTRMKKEMREVRDRLGAPRRCALKEGSPIVERPAAPAIVVPAKPGHLVKTGRNWIRWAQRNNISRQVGSDYVTSITPITDQDTVEVIDDTGLHYRIKVAELVDVKAPLNPAAKVKVQAGAQVLLVGNGHDAKGKPQDVIMVSAQGTIKRVTGEEWAAHRAGRSYPMVTLDAGDKLIAAFFLPTARTDIGLLNASGRLLRMKASTILPKGGKAKAIPGIKVNPNDATVWAGPLNAGDRLVYTTVDDRVGWFSIDDVAYGNRLTQGQAITRSAIQLNRVLIGEGTSLRWFGADREEPGVLELTGQTVGTQLSDRQLKLRADGLDKAAAIWIE